MSEFYQEQLGYIRKPGTNLFIVPEGMLPRGIKYRVVIGEPIKNKNYGSSAPVHVFKAGFDNGLGKYIGSKGERKAALREINDKTGSNIVEVGNERPNVKPVQKKVNKQAMSEYMQHLRNQRG